MVLDEGQTSLNYLNMQGLSTANAYTLILKRTLTPGQWASITLPVNLTAAQFKTAFGDQAKLSTFEGQDNALKLRLRFKTVDLSNDKCCCFEGKYALHHEDHACCNSSNWLI